METYAAAPPPKVSCFAPAALASKNIEAASPPPKVMCFAPAALAGIIRP
jgi:hypothetical protein